MIAALPMAGFRGLDPRLAWTAAILLAWGLVMVASASVAVAERSTGVPLYYFLKQLTYLGVGAALGALMFAVPMKNWEKSGFWLLAFAFVLLVLVLIPGVGVKVNEAQRWLDLGLFRLQSSEPARLALLVYLAGYIVRRQAQVQNQISGVVKPLAPILLACVLLLLEPDYGAAVVLVAVAFLMLFVGGARLRHLFALAAPALGALVILAVAAPYRLARLIAFINPWEHVNTSGWQLTQSLIAVGRGEWTGAGLGNSVQKLLYLPETHTDFIFAVLAEEFGLLGVAVLLALFGLLVWRSFAIGRECEQANRRFPAYLCYGLGGWIGLQALVNMAVNMGLAPTKGLTLPLVSYGGSSLVTVCATLALILRADYENRLDRAGSPVGGLR